MKSLSPQQSVYQADNFRGQNTFPRHVNVPAKILFTNEAFYFERDGISVTPPVGLDTVPILVHTRNLTEWVRYQIGKVAYGLIEKPSNLRVHAWHQRSASLPSSIYYDAAGKPYSCVNLKGVGNILCNKDGVWCLDNAGGLPSATGPWGYVLEKYACTDVEMTERFYTLGIHSHRVIAHLRPEYVFCRGSFLSPEEFSRRYSQGSLPLIQLRAFTVPTRLLELEPSPYIAPQHARALLNEAWAMINLHTGHELETDDEYIVYLVRTVARQVALMHAQGYVHNFLSGHNITLDGGLVDLDGVKWYHNQNEAKFIQRTNEDCITAVCTLSWFLNYYPLPLSRRIDIEKLFTETYQQRKKAIIERGKASNLLPRTT